MIAGKKNQGRQFLPEKDYLQSWKPVGWNHCRKEKSGKKIFAWERLPSKLKAWLQLLLGACSLHHPPHPSPSLKSFSINPTALTMSKSPLFKFLSHFFFSRFCKLIPQILTNLRKKLLKKFACWGFLRLTRRLIIDCHTALLMKMHPMQHNSRQHFSHFKPIRPIFDLTPRKWYRTEIKSFCEDFYWVLLPGSTKPICSSAAIWSQILSGWFLWRETTMRKITFQQTLSLGWHTFETKGHENNSNAKQNQ